MKRPSGADRASVSADFVDVRKFGFEKALRFRRVGQFFEAAPQARTGSGVSVIHGHRWHVEQSVRLSTTTSCNAIIVSLDSDADFVSVIENKEAGSLSCGPGLRWQSRHQPIESVSVFTVSAI